MWRRELCDSRSTRATQRLGGGTRCWWERASWDWEACFDILDVPVAYYEDVRGGMDEVTWELLLRAEKGIRKVRQFY